MRVAGGDVTCRNCGATFNALFASSGDKVEQAAEIEIGEGTGRSSAIALDADAGARHDQRDELPRFSGRAERIGKWKPIPISLDEDGDETTDKPVPAQASVRARLGWMAGTLFLGGLLVWQGIVFEGPKLARQEALRPWLDGFCKVVGCGLPKFRKVESIRVIDRGLHAAPE